MHANRAEDVPARLEALGTAAGLSRPAVHSQLAAALHAVIHLVRVAGRRRVAEVALFERRPDGLVVAVPAVRFPAGGVVAGPGADRLRELVAGAVDDAAGWP